jgi:hypothetical protein
MRVGEVRNSKGRATFWPGQPAKKTLDIDEAAAITDFLKPIN